MSPPSTILVGNSESESESDAACLIFNGAVCLPIEHKDKRNNSQQFSGGWLINEEQYTFKDCWSTSEGGGNDLMPPNLNLGLK